MNHIRNTIASQSIALLDRNILAEMYILRQVELSDEAQEAINAFACPNCGSLSYCSCLTSSPCDTCCFNGSLECPSICPCDAEMGVDYDPLLADALDHERWEAEAMNLPEGYER